MDFKNYFAGDEHKDLFNFFINNFDKLSNVLFLYKQVQEWKLFIKDNNDISDNNIFAIDMLKGKVFAINFLIDNDFVGIVDKVSIDTMDRFLYDMEKWMNNGVFLSKHKRESNFINPNDFINGAISTFNDVFKLMFTDSSSEILNQLNEDFLNLTMWNNNTLKNCHFIDEFELKNT